MERPSERQGILQTARVSEESLSVHQEEQILCKHLHHHSRNHPCVCLFQLFEDRGGVAPRPKAKLSGIFKTDSLHFALVYRKYSFFSCAS